MPLVAWMPRCVVFTDSNCIRRTDIKTRSYGQPQNHTKDSLFKDISINMTDCFPTDYIDTLHLGITGRILLWSRLTVSRRSLFSAQGFQRLNDRVQKCRPQISCEFPSVCSTLDDLDYNTGNYCFKSGNEVKPFTETPRKRFMFPSFSLRSF